MTQRRTMQDFAHQMRWLVDEAYPEVPVVRVVLDNLNTHRTASLYETFPAAEARRIARRLEFHYTPKHGRTIAKLFDSRRRPQRWEDSKVGIVDSRFRGKDGLGQVPLRGKTLQSSCQTWELAEHGGNRVQRTVPLLPEATTPR